MNIAQISSQFFTAAMPAIGAGVGIVGVLLAVSGCLLRWKMVCRFVRRFAFWQPQYSYRRVFSEYLERLGQITDRRELYPAILQAACRIVGASGASLIVRDSHDRFQIKASVGLRPFSFEMGEVKPFLEWLEKRRAIVARRDLVHSRALADIKSEGLCYFVQFGAEACIPLFVNERLYGIVNLGRRDVGHYDGETRDMLKLLAVQFATSIHNANLYQALLKQNLDLQETSRFKTQLLANISHELRTPLTGIIGLSELMGEGADGIVNEDQKKHLKLIRHSGVRLLETVTAMLDISKLEANRLGLNVQKVNVGRIVNGVAGEMRLNDDTKMELKISDDMPGVWGDEYRLKQIFKHLLDNAAKFTRRGKISVEAEKCGEMLRIKIKDTGIGIARENQKAIFEGFRQADGSSTREHEGLGLGLAISRKLVELHGGRMWLASEPGKGSEFSLTLPLKPVGIFTKSSQAAA